MLDVLKIQFSKQKLMIWAYTYEFEDNYEGVSEPVKWLKLVI